jgi:hypothetical protein
MPELTPQSIAATPPPVPPIPPEDEPPAAAVPSTIDPAAWEAFPVFRESFLMYISEPSFNASLRTAAEHFFGMLLETYQHWPAWQETTTRTEMRAALGDLRHLQGFLASVGKERRLSSLDEGDARLSKHASQVARLLKQVGDTIERKLAKGAAS